MHTGHCLCGQVRYELAGELGPIVFCHCSQCRRASGTAFATNAPVRARDFTLVAGREHVREFESSPRKIRAFCTNCGSPLYSRRLASPETVRLRLGTLDAPIGARPTAHIYATSNADWYRITDDLPQYEGPEPQR
jgi:hypothetical protein